jgi:Ca-activated chloride channel family protein
MKFNPDDPKWSAYLLGELTADERAAVEQELETSAEAREFLEELRLTAAIMKEELSAHAAFGLRAEQREAIEAAVERPKRWFTRPAVWAIGAAAATFAIGLALVPASLRSRQAVAEQSTPIAAVQPAPQIKAQFDTPAAPETSKMKVAPLPQRAGRRKDEAAQRDELSFEGQTQQGQNQQGQTQQGQSQLGADRADAPSAAPSGSPRTGVLSGMLNGVLRAQEEAAPPPPAPAAPRAAPAAPPPPRMADNFGFSASATLPSAALDRIQRLPANNESYNAITDNGFIAVSQQPLATFSSDVDTASYANVRRFITQNQWPPKDAVRIEEMINYFSYAYPQSSGPHPIAATMEVAAAPWNPQHRLVRIGIKAKDVQMGRKPSNLVFLIDVSGSMGTPERLPLLKSGLRMLVEKLTENDTVSIVVYAGASGIALQPTSGEKKEVINRAIENLQAGGSTNGGAGIRLAYELAVSNFIRGGINRVILATDGDFNVGVTSQGELLQLIEDRAKSGAFLTVLGFGMGNLKDSTLELLADRGNGHYAYIDSLNEARKVLVEEMGSTLVTVAKDVKLQVEFNPAQVNAYRLIGYEKRVLRAEDFNNDQKDAGDMGAGHTVTALFEVVPPGVKLDGPGVDPLRYQQPAAVPALRNGTASNEMLNLKIRYKDPDATESKLLQMPLTDRGISFSNASADFRFAAAVAGFGMILRDSPYKGSATLDWVSTTATNSRGADVNGYRGEFIRLVQRSMQLGLR